MQGTAGDLGDPKARDSVDRVSSRVQAVACFFPATDFLNFGEKGHVLLSATMQPQFRAALDYHEFDKDKRVFVPVADEKKALEIARQISPIYHVTADDPPTLIIHGDKIRWCRCNSRKRSWRSSRKSACRRSWWSSAAPGTAG